MGNRDGTIVTDSAIRYCLGNIIKREALMDWSDAVFHNVFEGGQIHFLNDLKELK